MKTIFSAAFILIFSFFNTGIKAQNKMVAKQNLDLKQQRIVTIAAFTAKGDIPRLKACLSKGLDDGLTINEIKEVLVQLYAYCGFPRSLNGINALMAVLDERKAIGISDAPGRDASPVNDNNRYLTGKQTLQTLTGVEEKGPKKGANGFAPVIDTFLKEHLFADIFSRDILSYQQRELATISALAAMSGVESQLQSHIGIGLNTGLSEEQLTQALVLIKDSIGKNEAAIAGKILSKALTIKQNEK
ncbi:carboxymuconolactone decarboxylase family protein [Mucilaginibacter sp. KACC 22773]|uniref:carboxymuconolactone decarboxylase family protein n=1 Tax=Mucilaginibacter sp. KACC 22773 TaxID=3025671 RepID=UPI0023669287|nr:carboxymuconolactone decarboxylase family protein [Mucilaginibacter sp. KACC 22773]WDF77169.1 carboxymuconolactone decarboxylase family protein [Mucilaginibacter sp. KACC 22773]